MLPLFVETRIFTARTASLGLEGDLRQLQLELLGNPELGPTEPGTGGLRKARMAGGGKGKRGGARVHYLWLARHRVIYLLFVYSKHEQDKLDARQKKQLRYVVEQIKAGWE